MPSFLSTAYTPHEGCAIKEVKIQKKEGDISHYGGIMTTYQEGEKKDSEYEILVTFDEESHFGHGYENIEKFDTMSTCKDKTINIEINEVLIRPYDYNKSPVGWKLFTIWKNFVELGTPITHVGGTTYKIPLVIKHNAPELPDIPEAGIVLRVELRFFVRDDPLASSVYLIYRQTRAKPSGCGHSTVIETTISKKENTYGQFLHYHRFNDNSINSMRFSRFTNLHFDIARVQRYPVPPLENHILTSNIGLSDESITAAGTNLQILQQRIRKEVVLILVGNGYEMDKFSQYANDISVVQMTPNIGRNDQNTQELVARENNFVHKFIQLNEKTRLFTRILYFDMKNGKPLETKDMLKAYSIVQKKAKEFSESSNIIVISTTNFEFHAQNRSLHRLFEREGKNILYLAYSGDAYRDLNPNTNFIYPATMASVVTIGSLLNLNTASSNFGTAVDMFCKGKTSIDALSYMLIIYGIFWKLDNEKTADEIKKMVQNYLQTVTCDRTNTQINIFQNADFILSEQFPNIFKQPHNNGIIIEGEDEEEDEYTLEYSPNTTDFNGEGNGMIVEEFNEEGIVEVVLHDNTGANTEELQRLKKELTNPLVTNYLQKYDHLQILQKYLGESFEHNEKLDSFASKLVSGDVSRMFLFGTPSSGKSSLLRLLILKMINQQLQNNSEKRTIPFFTSLTGVGEVDDPIPYLMEQVPTSTWSAAQQKLLIVDDADHSPMFNYHIHQIQAYCQENNIKLVISSARKLAHKKLWNKFHVLVVKPSEFKGYIKHIMNTSEKLKSYSMDKLQSDYDMLCQNIVTIRFLLQMIGVDGSKEKNLFGKFKQIFNKKKVFTYQRFEEMMLAALKTMNSEISSIASSILPYIAHWSLLNHKISFSLDILDKFEISPDRLNQLKANFSKIIFFKQMEHYNGEKPRYTFAHPIFAEFWAARHLISLAKDVKIEKDVVKVDTKELDIFYKTICAAVSQPRYHDIFQYILDEQMFPNEIMTYLAIQLPIPFEKINVANKLNIQHQHETRTKPAALNGEEESNLIQLISQKILMLDKMIGEYQKTWNDKKMKLSPELIDRQTEQKLVNGGEAEHLVYMSACLKKLVEEYKPYLTREPVQKLVDGLLIRVKGDSQLRDLFVDNVPNLATICNSQTKTKIFGYLKTHILTYHKDLLNGVMDDSRVPKVVEQLVNSKGLNDFVEFCNSIFKNDNSERDLKLCSIAMLNLVILAKEQSGTDTFKLQSVPSCSKNNLDSLIHSLSVLEQEDDNEVAYLHRVMTQVVRAFFNIEVKSINIQTMIQELQLMVSTFQTWNEKKNPSPSLSRCIALMHVQLVRLVSYISRHPDLNINNINGLLEIVTKLETSSLSVQGVSYVIDYRLRFFLQYIKDTLQPEKVGRMIDTTQHHAIIHDLISFILKQKNQDIMPLLSALSTDNPTVIKLILELAKPNKEVIHKYGDQFIQWACDLIDNLHRSDDFCRYFTEYLVPYLGVDYDSINNTERIQSMIALLSKRPIHEQQKMLGHLMGLQSKYDRSYHRMYDKKFQLFLHYIHHEYQKNMLRDYRY